MKKLLPRIVRDDVLHMQEMMCCVCELLVGAAQRAENCRLKEEVERLRVENRAVRVAHCTSLLFFSSTIL